MNWVKEASSSLDFGRFGLNLKGFLVESGGLSFRRGNLPLNPLELVSKGRDGAYHWRSQIRQRRVGLLVCLDSLFKTLLIF